MDSKTMLDMAVQSTQQHNNMVNNSYLDLIHDHNIALGLLAMAYPLLYGGRIVCNRENLKPLLDNFLKQNEV